MAMWFYFSLLAAALWGVATIIDDYIIGTFLKNPLINALVYSIIGLVSGIFIFLYMGPFPLNAVELALALASGAFYTISISMYFISLKHEEVTRVVPLVSLATLSTIFFAWIFLGESFTPIVYLGIALMITGSVLISLKFTKTTKGHAKYDLSKALFFMTIGAVFSGFSGVMQKYLIDTAIPSEIVFGYSRIGVAIPAIFIFFFVAKDIKKILYEKKKHILGYMVGSETVTIIATFFVFVAMSFGAVTLVSATLTTEPVFTLLFASVIGVFMPKLLEQEINRRVILHKAMAILLIIMGMLMLPE